MMHFLSFVAVSLVSISSLAYEAKTLTASAQMPGVQSAMLDVCKSAQNTCIVKIYSLTNFDANADFKTFMEKAFQDDAADAYQINVFKGAEINAQTVNQISLSAKAAFSRSSYTIVESALSKLAAPNYVGGGISYSPYGDHQLFAVVTINESTKTAEAITWETGYSE